MSVNELATALGQEQSMISHNLKPLLECNLITIQKQGKKHIYTANQETLNPIFEAIQNHAQKFCPTGGKCLKGETLNEKKNRKHKRKPLQRMRKLHPQMCRRRSPNSKWKSQNYQRNLLRRTWVLVWVNVLKEQ